jgi:uncharacterized membrane protein
MVKRKSARRSWWRDRGVRAGALAAVMAAIMLAGFFLLLKTKNGTLMIEVDELDSTVQLLNEGKVEVNLKGDVGKSAIRIDPGKYRLQIEKNGFATFSEEINLESGENKAIMIHLKPKVSTEGAARQE